MGRRSKCSRVPVTPSSSSVASLSRPRERGWGRGLISAAPGVGSGQGRHRMHVGMASVFQNPKRGRSDFEVYRNELRLAELAEPLGFESVWGVEHHFTDYTMCPDVLQFLTYMAGRTQRAQLGSMVVVLPWHDPLRVAEEVSMLDNISDGRLILGLGRGAGRVEFDGFRTTYRDINRTEAPPPVCAGWTFCDENPARAHEMARRYIGGYYQTVLDHYNFQGDHLAKTKGYEYYGKMAEKIAQYGTDKVIEYFMNLQVWGTPEQCYEKILDVRGRVGNDTFVGVFSYAGMDYGEAERNMRLFARTVMPQLQKLPPAAAPAPAAAAPRAGKELGVGLLGS